MLVAGKGDVSKRIELGSAARSTASCSCHGIPREATLVPLPLRGRVLLGRAVEAFAPGRDPLRLIVAPREEKRGRERHRDTEARVE